MHVGPGGPTGGSVHTTCTLRVLPGATEFDTDYGCVEVVDLVAGGREEGLFVGGNRELYVVGDRRS